jgi:hypothetical protein
MKKSMITLAMILVMCSLLALPALAADGSSFETAIRIPLQPGDERGSALDENYTKTPFTFTSFDQSVYFVFTPDTTDAIRFDWTGQLRFHLYDDRLNPIDLGDDEVQRGNTYYLRVEFRGNEATFNRDAPINAEIGVILYTPEWQAPLWLVLGLFGGFLFVVLFPYRRHMIKNYELNPVELKPLLYSMGLSMVYMAVMMFASLNAMWPIFLCMAPGVVIPTLKLLKVTKKPKILAIHIVLMLGFYGLMGLVAMFVFFLVVMAAVVVFGLKVLPMVLRSGGGGSGGGGETSTCPGCGSLKYKNSPCGCGR